MIDTALFDNGRSDWGTPRDVFSCIHDIFGFNLDVCAQDWNAVVQRYITPQRNAFLVPWVVEGEERTVAWMNPPYGNGESACERPYSRCKKKKCIRRGYHIDQEIPGVKQWIARAVDQVVTHGIDVVTLIAARTETRVFQRVFREAKAICFVKGRMSFILPGGQSAGVAPFPSAIAVFSPHDISMETRVRLAQFGNVVHGEGVTLCTSN